LNIDTVQLLGLIITIVPYLLLMDGVDGNGSLASLTVTNNQVTLMLADG
jgi:hypothetical protein